MTAYGTVETAVAAMKEGAYDFITKPLKRHAIVKSVRQALERASLVAENRALKARLAELAPGVGGLVGDAPAFRAVLETLRQAAPTSATVLLVGESGTGKELAARLVHDLSPRAARPVRPDQLRGDPRGAPRVGAVRPREGGVHRRRRRARRAASSAPTAARSSSTRSARCRPRCRSSSCAFLQDGVLERVGGTEPLQVDVRIVAATNKDLAAEVKAGRFREDLFYRLDVVAVRLPPLRERREDVLAPRELLPAPHRRGAPEAGDRLHPRGRRGARALPLAGERPRAAARRRARGDPRRAARCSRWATSPTRSAARRPRPRAGRRRRAARAPSLIPLGTPMEEVERLVIRGPSSRRRATRTSPPSSSGSPRGRSTGSSTATRRGACVPDREE